MPHFPFLFNKLEALAMEMMNLLAMAQYIAHKPIARVFDLTFSTPK
jgi:hypothetical protein